MLASSSAYSLSDVRAIYDLPFPELMFRAQEVHRQHHKPGDVQLCSLLSVKTGGCPEDCGYCSQSSRYESKVDPQKMLTPAEVLDAARKAKQAGAQRFCMGAAWREVKEGPAFEGVLEMVRGVRALGMEACCTLGMLTEDQAKRLGDAGLTAYNHNLDTSRAFYKSIITTRTYDDRLRTLDNVRKAGISVCCGGIIGLGESVEDRLSLLQTLANLTPHPESVPINALAPMEGTPLAQQKPIDPLDFARVIATARILMPTSRVRLSAGRLQMSREAQVLCFLAGANSIFFGEKLLTTGNPDVEADRALLTQAGFTFTPGDVELDSSHHG